MIRKMKEELDSNLITSEELFNEAIKKAKESKDINAFVTITDEYKIDCTNKTLLTGIPYALKDNISTKGILTTASSNILKDYVPVYDATVYKKLKEAGAVLVGKTTMDELAMGGTGTTAHTGIVRNPLDLDRMIGGSSSGSAAAVASGIVPFAIGSDTGDSIRKPASYSGIVGFKPTYGRVSRYGLFAFASSLDHVGTLTKTVEDAAIVMDVIKGHDEHDMTSLEDENICYLENINNDIKGKKLFYIKEICDIDSYDELDELTKQNLNSFKNNLERLKKQGFIIEGISIDKDLLSAIYPCYMTISCAEATSNDANLNGILYGVRGSGKSINDIMFDSRTKGFSELIKRRFVLGSYVLQKENQEKLFKNAGRIRRIIVNKINDLFKTYDGMILPGTSSIAPKFDEKSDALSLKYLLLDSHLIIGNFGGFPSITLPSGKVNNMPISINLTGRVFEDNEVLNMANIIEKSLKEGLDV